MVAAAMAHGSPMHKLYKSIIEDVIEGLWELFAEEGVEEQVLKDLKQLWETKVMQSKATEGFFRHSHPCPQLTLQLPHNFQHVLQASAASLVIPAGRGFPHFMTPDLGALPVDATLTLPSTITYPVHVPAGVTLQTASGQLYKVNVPIVVTQASGDPSTLHQPVQQIFHPAGQPPVLQASVAQVNASSAQAAAETLHAQETAAQQTIVNQPNVVEKNHHENSVNTTFVQQPSVCQQQLATSTVFNQHADSTENPHQGNLHTAVFTPESPEGFSPPESLASNSSSVLLDVEGVIDIEPLESVQQQVSDDIIDLIIMGKSMEENTVHKDQDSTATSNKILFQQSILIDVKERDELIMSLI